MAHRLMDGNYDDHLSGFQKYDVVALLLMLLRLVNFLQKVPTSVMLVPLISCVLNNLHQRGDIRDRAVLFCLQ